MAQDQHKIEWNGDVPVSTQFDDPFYSFDNGLAESQYVFLQGNDLPDRFQDGFHVGELGFGTGLNFLTTLRAFREAGGPGTLRFTSFEAFPMPLADLKRALGAFRGLPSDIFTSLTDETLPLRMEGNDFDLRIIPGQAGRTLPPWEGVVDAWYLDGFAPAKNPGMWTAEMMAEVAKHTAPGGTFATYTAVGDVRRALEAAGFAVTRCAGFGRKRHMTRGRLR
ncbi:tRNA (5-methylaminomethyl-2-thiouridine)(34)-methyltransferase MnmD [Gymnodinialimonas ulvae]|uniref:tRNA (5-methylaminomethyl-2-thiouridine)(34)-methyltransferase MnmD n=1 Tax=Gymnodinialimonas ulvae TaxID=3126504 RepID=UPI0030B1BCDB